jgi:hypothetical protein
LEFGGLADGHRCTMNFGHGFAAQLCSTRCSRAFSLDVELRQRRAPETVDDGKFRAMT